jgi:hypothetical protein
LTRPSHFTRPPHRLTDVGRAYVVTGAPLSREFASGYAPPSLIATVPIKVRGETIGALNVRLYSKLEPHAEPSDARPVD